MSDDITGQMQAIFQTNSVQFALQVDESTDVAGLAQLMVFIRFIHYDKITEEFLCCVELLRTRGEDIFQALDNFMEENNMSWLNCVGICIDGAPSMLGTVKDFTTLARKKNENIIITRCFLHREALVAQTVGEDLRRVINEVILMVSYIKSKLLKSRQFHQICEEMGAHFKTLLLHTQVRWLSKGRMLSRVFDLKDIMFKFFEENHQSEFCNPIKNEVWCIKLPYLWDIFEHLNRVNQSTQGRAENILTSIDKICIMREKIEIWRRKVKKNFEMFPKLSNCEATFQISSQMIINLTLLGDKLLYYFPNIEIENYDWIRNPFLAKAPTDLSLTEEEELAEIKNNRCLQLIYEEGDIQKFWIHVLKIHSNLAKKAVKILLQFSTTYICKASFSAMLNLKTKKRGNSKMLDSELRVAVP